jgi:hypothetical protein
MGRIAGRFARVEPRRRVRALVLGLLSDLPRKNCWSITEWAGEAGPDGMQHLLGRARWDADRVRDDVREYVLEHLGDENACWWSTRPGLRARRRLLGRHQELLSEGPDDAHAVSEQRRAASVSRAPACVVRSGVHCRKGSGRRTRPLVTICHTGRRRAPRQRPGMGGRARLRRPWVKARNANRPERVVRDNDRLWSCTTTNGRTRARR